MQYAGTVRGGVVVLEGGPALPEGASVTVSYPATGGHSPRPGGKRIEVPLVRTGRPGSVKLDAARVAEILDADDLAPRP